MDAIKASIVITVTGCEEWWFGGVGCEKGNVTTLNYYLIKACTHVQY